MTMVHFRLADPSGIPLDGYVSLVPTRRVTVGDEIRLPTALRVPLQDGEATVDMMPSTTQWVWRVAELVKGGITRYVAVPDTDTVVEYADLESVDPASLDVSSAAANAWEIATRTAQDMLDRVGEIDGKVERAEDAAAGAESSASEAESHETAAKSSADAAASSARDAASSATAAASSAGSAASSASAAASSASGAASSAGEASGSAEAAAGSVSTAASHATAAAQSATAAAKNVAEAASSASAAASSAEQAANIVASVSGSVTQAENAARSASQSSTAAAGSASAAGGSAQAAADSASKAGESATAAGLSERNAASSATQAAQSATAAAQSATAAQQAVDGFGLEVGTTTTGEPGTDAAVEIQKDGTKYTASFTIPRGDVGPAGVNENVPLGSVSGVVAQASDAYPMLPRKLQVHGRTIENLWPEFSPTSSNGLSLSIDASGFITVSGTPNASTVYLRKDSNIPSGTYKFIHERSSNNIEGYINYKGNSTGSGYSSDSGNTIALTNNGDGFICYVKLSNLQVGSPISYNIQLMLVEGDANPDVFVPSGVHTVEPTKLVAAGRNQWYPFLTEQYVRDGITVTQNSDASYTIDGENTGNGNIYVLQKYPSSSKNFLAGETVTVSCWDAQGNNISDEISDRLYVQMTVYQELGQSDVTTSSKYTGVIPNNYTGDRFQITIKPGASFDNLKIYPQAEFGNKATPWKTPISKIETDLPSGINLADGDTLTIDRDGTTQILHAEGEPTVLENVTLPELPAPTFNVYTTGGYVQPTVDVTYERDVSLVLQALEAKIAALQVADKTN